MDSPPVEDLNDLYENAPCGYLSIQPDGRIVKVNATLATWTAYSAEELLSLRVHDLLNMAGRIFYETHFAPLLRMQGFFHEVALDLVRRDGGALHVLVNAAERRDPHGSHLFTRLTIFNATDRRRYERELLEARTAAEEAKRELQRINTAITATLRDEQATAALREQFIAVLGHDLRNPLGAISAAAHVISLCQTPEPVTRSASLIQASARRMAHLIDDVLDFTRGRLGGGLTVERTADEPLEPLLRQVVDELQLSNPRRVIDARFEIPGPVYCDRRRIAQLLSNLVANALTHGAPDQPVRVRGCLREGGFELWVANAGEPIAPVTMERLFQPFYRGQVRASQHGLGLGLYIASEIALAHHGTLTVDSDPAETRFTFRMPQRGPQVDAEPFTGDRGRTDDRQPGPTS